MARPIRVEYFGAVYHATSRGNERRKIFRDDEDRRRFSATLAVGSPAELWVNRPFFFAVQHIPTGACILHGHVVNPRENLTR
jgi:putative transposase